VSRLGGLGGPAPLAVKRGIGDGLQFAQAMGAAKLGAGVEVAAARRPGVMDGDPRERGQNPYRLHRVLPAPGMHHEQGVLAGAGAVHPAQPALHPEPGLVGPGHATGGDALPHPPQETIELPGGTGR
jgi:hypothetical protein